MCICSAPGTGTKKTTLLPLKWTQLLTRSKPLQWSTPSRRRPPAARPPAPGRDPRPLERFDWVVGPGRKMFGRSKAERSDATNGAAFATNGAIGRYARGSWHRYYEQEAKGFWMVSFPLLGPRKRQRRATETASIPSLRSLRSLSPISGSRTARNGICLCFFLNRRPCSASNSLD